MGGGVAVLFLRPKHMRSLDSPTCLFNSDSFKKEWILLRESLAGNPQNSTIKVPRMEKSGNYHAIIGGYRFLYLKFLESYKDL